MSRAIVLGEGEDQILKEMPQYMAGGLLKYFPEMSDGSDSLTVYVLSVAEAAKWKMQDGVLRSLLEGLQDFVNGKSYQTGFIYPAADLSLRKLAAMEVLSRHQAFDPAMLESVQAEPNLLPVAGLLDLRALLRREKAIPKREERLKAVEQQLRSRLQWRGKVAGFREESREALWWLMGSADREVNRLVHAVADDPAWAPDLGRLVRGSIARMRHGSWDLTTANAWGVLAMRRFSELFEKEAVSGQTTVTGGGTAREIAWSGGSREASFPFGSGKEQLKVEHKGAGKPWAFLSSRAAVALKEPIFKGYRIRRSVKAVEQKAKGRWSVGDLYRVTLEVSAPTGMTWVAVTDPIPAGATVLGSGLGRDSALRATTPGAERTYWLSQEERSFEGYRAYFEWLPEGETKLEYTVRINSAGEFQLPNTRVEAMYSPDQYAEAPNGKMAVAP